VNTEEWTPLTLALANSSPDQYLIAKLLIDNGANVHSKEVSPILLLLAGEYDISMKSAYLANTNKGDSEEEIYNLFLFLIENGVSLEQFEAAEKLGISYSNQILYHTVTQGNVLILEYIIEKEQFDFNAKLFKGETALMIAVRNEDRTIIRYLLSKGADKEIQNDDGETVYDIVEESGSEEMAQLLRL